MPRQRNPKRYEAYQMWKDSGGKMKLVDIAHKLDMHDSQLRKWKAEDKWMLDNVNTSIESNDDTKRSDPIKRENSKPKKNSPSKRSDPIDESARKSNVRVFVNGTELQPVNEKRITQNHPGGRMRMWDTLDMPSKLDAVRGWCMHGSTDEEISEMLGISPSTFYKWKNEYPEFAEAVKRGKDIANGELLNAAFRQAIGFTYTEQQAIKVRKVDKHTGLQYEEVELVDVERVSPPNSVMQIFMLKNRLAGDYKDKQEVAHSGQVTTVDKKEIHVIEEVIQKDNEIANRLVEGIRTARLGSNSGD